MTLDEHFTQVGLEALLHAPDAKLIARANHIDNFTVCFAGTVQLAVGDAVDIFNPEHVHWYNAYIGTSDRSGQIRAASNNAFNQTVCRTAYDRLRVMTPVPA